MFSIIRSLPILLFFLDLKSNGARSEGKVSPFSQDFIDYINSLNTTWKAGRNFAPDTSPDYIRSLLGVLPEALLPENRLLRHKDKEQNFDVRDLPAEFDARTAWPFCPSTKEIRDQGACASSWAVAAVSAITDRQCIHTKGASQIRYSDSDVIDCCNQVSTGCNGGFQDEPWQYWVDVGIVSGGPFNSKSGCKPYEIAPCSHAQQGTLTPCGAVPPTPTCTPQCIPEYNVTYVNDRHVGKSAYLVSRAEEAIKQEIMTNGPIGAVLIIYEDFLSYKSGVYQHVAGDLKGGHAVKMLGWGVENSTPYWLLANSWNSEWGEQGFFRVRRGNNECGIEGRLHTGMPKV